MIKDETVPARIFRWSLGTYTKRMTGGSQDTVHTIYKIGGMDCKGLAPMMTSLFQKINSGNLNGPFTVEDFRLGRDVGQLQRHMYPCCSGFHRFQLELQFQGWMAIRQKLEREGRWGRGEDAEKGRRPFTSTAQCSRRNNKKEFWPS